MDEIREETNSAEAIRQEIKEKKRTYWRGAITGAASVMAVLLIVLLIGIYSGTVVIGGKGVTGGSQTVAASDGDLLSRDVINKLDNLADQINADYYEDVDQEDLINGMYKGLFEGIGDPYSEYYTPEEYEDIMISTHANYYGIGAGLTQDKNTMEVSVTHIYDNSPAQEAGLKEGDKIVKVDDIEATSMELSELVTNIRGEEGTTVHLVIEREGESENLEFDVSRAKVDIPTVAYKMLENNIGYIQVSEFAENTPTQFSDAITDLQGQGMEKLVIDLRDNGGGMVVSCQQMLDMILPEGTVVYTEDKYGNRQDYTSDAEHYLDMPIAVLVNGNSASASEIFAGAIRDFDYGTLIGTTTFGKGIVQNIMQLKDGSAIKLTVAKYYTPNGDNIHGTGITPDVEIEYEYTGDTEGTYDEMQDNQILKAIEVLNGEE